MALCGTAFAQSASDFTVNANGVITKYTGFDTVVVIPATIGGRKITAIGNEAFRKADITSVTIPGSVKTIDRNAFRGNTALATIVISEEVETIYSGAFADTKCTSVSLPSTITNLSDTYTGAQFDTSGKPSFTLAANIKTDFPSIPAFYSYIANDRKAGTYAYLSIVRKSADDYEYVETQYGAVLTKYTGNSTRVRVPDKIGGIAVKALYRTFQYEKLAAVQIPEGITYIGVVTFMNNELANVTIPDSVTYIGIEAFTVDYNNGRGQLTSVTIGSNVELGQSLSDDGTRYGVFGYNFNFDNCYNDNKKTAGTYTYANGNWKKQ